LLGLVHCWFTVVVGVQLTKVAWTIEKSHYTSHFYKVL
jgi:hypothetical protein